MVEGFPDAGMMAIMYSDRYCAQNSSYWEEICQLSGLVVEFAPTCEGILFCYAFFRQEDTATFFPF